MRIRTLIALAASVALSVPAAFAAVTFAEFASAPEKAVVSIDGVRRGTTPLQLSDITTGVSHHIRLELNNFVTVDEMVKAEGEEPIRKYYTLKPVKGILLVTTEPEGAEVVEDDFSLGTTPRLVTSLAVKDRHTLVLKKEGYQEAKLSVKFNGRRPVVHHVKLVKDSGTVEIRTQPSGALAIVNGITCGRTPVTANNVVKGLVTVELKKDGYKTEKRELRVAAGDVQQLGVTLEPLPGSLRLSSVPAGARFYMDDLPLPSGDPCVKKDVRPGTYSVRAELDGYATLTRSVTVPNGGEAAEEFRLENVMGSLEVRTMPPEATVWVDGRRRGTTLASDAASSASDVLRIDNITEGEHEIKITKPGYAEWRKLVTFEAKKTVEQKVKLRERFMPDVRITTTEGDVIEGMIVDDENPTYISIRTATGHLPRILPRDKIRKREPITPTL